MELKLEKKCRTDELEIGKRYAIGECGRYPFVVTDINYERGYVLLSYLNDPQDGFVVTDINYERGYVLPSYLNDPQDGLVYLDSHGYYYEFPLSSLEKELL